MSNLHTVYTPLKYVQKTANLNNILAYIAKCFKLKQRNETNC